MYNWKQQYNFYSNRITSRDPAEKPDCMFALWAAGTWRWY